MNRTKELCRNFQRGSCQYGDRCKFLHTTQQQQKYSPFGFGAQKASPFLTTNQQHQQQKSNPFGFGVQNASHSRGASNTGGHYLSQPQPFINKWTRSSSAAAVSTKPSKQGDTQTQGVAHKCTDPESCKCQITEDFNQERPLWRLTCYGHGRSLPCDIVGDISYEELRVAAYEDARRGLSLQIIVERERNLLNSKLMEFDSFLRNSCALSQRTDSAGPSSLPAINHSPSSVDAQRHIAPSFSRFSQPGASANVGPTIRCPSPVNSTFGQANSFQVPSQISRAFDVKIAQNSPDFGNGSVTAQSSPFFHPVAQSMQVSSSSTYSLPGHVDGHGVAANIVSPPLADGHPSENRQEIDAGGFAIWLKEEWEIGEIPEEEPPARFRA